MFSKDCAVSVTVARELQKECLVVTAMGHVKDSSIDCQSICPCHVGTLMSPGRTLQPQKQNPKPIYRPKKGSEFHTSISICATCFGDTRSQRASQRAWTEKNSLVFFVFAIPSVSWVWHFYVWKTDKLLTQNVAEQTGSS